jgi:acetoin utilization protein AcuB
MCVQDVMTEGVETISPVTAVEDAWNVMRTKRIHHLVVTKGSRIVGVLSDRDTGGPKGAIFRRTRTVGELMTAPVVTVPPETTVRKAANLMRGRSIGCLVVANGGGRIAGIVTISDLLDLIGRGLDRHLTAGTRWPLNHRVPHRHTSRAVGVW